MLTTACQIVTTTPSCHRTGPSRRDDGHDGELPVAMTRSSMLTRIVITAVFLAALTFASVSCTDRQPTPAPTAAPASTPTSSQPPSPYSTPTPTSAPARTATPTAMPALSPIPTSVPTPTAVATEVPVASTVPDPTRPPIPNTASHLDTGRDTRSVTGLDACAISHSDLRRACAHAHASICDRAGSYTGVDTYPGSRLDADRGTHIRARVPDPGDTTMYSGGGIFHRPVRARRWKGHR